MPNKRPLSRNIRPPNLNNKPVQTSCISNLIAIPPDFLTTPSAKPITSTPISFSASPLLEYVGHTAILLANVLSPEECQHLIALAEASVVKQHPEESPWKPALVSMGPGWEVAAPSYRDSDRIVWDEQAVVDRIWARCAQAEGLSELLAEVPSKRGEGSGKWTFRGLNNRMRFLKYSPGQYFKPHCDGPYYCTADGHDFRTHYTVHLYLNDSAKESATGEGHVVGATSFLSRDEKRRLDVDPKAGSVLIFQHAGLYHEGARLEAGTKYTVRMDILYKWEQNELVTL
ncbi:hypothetical protein TOPH_07778 [Tolypocladium ophioglossoides CBS 100239]|uniref:Prolyl 4-hydroxylase alpha subunit domain-containing protein n=1 Tax=Tolypocladium ophioglossoides (strain CBS 100239) TaxID=1163406 RepID=A0A0L0N0P2_TOLOC|nr:hypothetical protein TOPH_07778 [Tolypocladium ophioglossoides CBS 100239]